MLLFSIESDKMVFLCTKLNSFKMDFHVSRFHCEHRTYTRNTRGHTPLFSVDTHDDDDMTLNLIVAIIVHQFTHLPLPSNVSIKNDQRQPDYATLFSLHFFCRCCYCCRCRCCCVPKTRNGKWNMKKKRKKSRQRWRDDNVIDSEYVKGDLCDSIQLYDKLANGIFRLSLRAHSYYIFQCVPCAAPHLFRSTKFRQLTIYNAVRTSQFAVEYKWTCQPVVIPTTSQQQQFETQRYQLYNPLLLKC